MKVILHLDLDSYFVSAERTVNDKLHGKPVVISGGERRSIISAASYEAKDLGIYVPMPFYKALELCPDLTFVKPNFSLYTVLSSKVFELISERFTKNIEVGSIDECYIDGTDIWQKYGSPKELALEMQKVILKELKLPCSIGVSNNKFLAKMSTSINKPLGITITKPGSHEEVFWEWPLEKFYGIGGKTASKLNKIGINTIGDLAKYDQTKLKDLLGRVGPDLIDKANGIGSDVIDSSHNDLKGIGNSKTFMEKDLSERKEILDEIMKLVQKVSYRAVKRNMVGRVVSLGIKEVGGKEIKVRRKQVTLRRPINSFDDIKAEIIDLFDFMWKEETIKFVSIHLAQIEDIFKSTYQMAYDDEVIVESKIEKIISDTNRKIKSKMVVTGKEFKMNTKKKQNQSRYLESDRALKHFDEGKK